MFGGTIYGVSMEEAADAILFYQRFKDTPTYQSTLKQIKREALELELAKINKQLEELK